MNFFNLFILIFALAFSWSLIAPTCIGETIKPMKEVVLSQAQTVVARKKIIERLYNHEQELILY